MRVSIAREGGVSPFLPLGDATGCGRTPLAKAPSGYKTAGFGNTDDTLLYCTAGIFGLENNSFDDFCGRLPWLSCGFARCFDVLKAVTDSSD